MIWFTEGTHYGHARIIEFEKRPFANVDEMDKELIKRHNEKVKPDDTVYHLGDFTLNRDLTNVAELFAKLNGHIFVVPGNHDKWIARMDGWRGSLMSASRKKVTILPPLYSLEIDTGEQHPFVVVLCHYPLSRWDRSHYSALHLYGHVGHEYVGEYNTLNVGVDHHDFYPVNMTQVKELITEQNKSKTAFPIYN